MIESEWTGPVLNAVPYVVDFNVVNKLEYLLKDIPSVIASACWLDRKVWIGWRHHSIFREMGLENVGRKRRMIQGFWTDNGLFLNRKVAKDLVFASKQIDKTISYTLTSEDLW